MKKITEYFTAEELLSINALAQCLKDKYFKENENAFELVFADALFIAYQLRQSEEYMESFNRLKATCDKRKNYMPLQIWEALAIRSMYLDESKTPKQAALFACVHFILEEWFAELFPVKLDLCSRGGNGTGNEL